jgi:hypothetical protein
MRLERAARAIMGESSVILDGRSGVQVGSLRALPRVGVSNRDADWRSSWRKTSSRSSDEAAALPKRLGTANALGSGNPLGRITDADIGRKRRSGCFFESVTPFDARLRA